MLSVILKIGINVMSKKEANCCSIDNAVRPAIGTEKAKMGAVGCGLARILG